MKPSQETEIIAALLDQSAAAHHQQPCPRQVLGARMGLFAGELLGIDLPSKDKHLLVIAETDGCAIDGLVAATGCHVGNRTLRIVDLGKVAATFVDIHTEDALRLVPRREARQAASAYAPAAKSAWEAMLFGYQVMPSADLFSIQRVELTNSLTQMISRPGKKAI